MHDSKNRAAKVLQDLITKTSYPGFNSIDGKLYNDIQDLFKELTEREAKLVAALNYIKAQATVSYPSMDSIVATVNMTLRELGL